MGGIILNYPQKELPTHYNIKYYNYAFKSYCISHSILLVKTNYVLWLDAGCGLAGPLNAERTILKWYGVYSPYSSTTIGELTYPSVLQEFIDERCHYSHRQMLSGGVQGYNLDNPNALALMAQWQMCVQVQSLISPSGASLHNHRYDQSLLSLVYYSRNMKVPYLGRFYYNIKIHLNRDYTHNKVSKKESRFLIRIKRCLNRYVGYF